MRLVAKKNDPSVRIRCPRAVLKRLTEIAEKNGRSRNTEIIRLLAAGLGMASADEK